MAAENRDKVYFVTSRVVLVARTELLNCVGRSVEKWNQYYSN